MTVPIERMMVGLDGNFGVLADFGWFPRPEKVGVDQHPLGQIIPDASLEKGNRCRAVLGLSCLCLVTHFFVAFCSSRPVEISHSFYCKF